MANASRRLKRKQETSKKESPKLDEAPANGQVQFGDQRVELSAGQAALFKQLIATSNDAQNQVRFAMIAAGITEQDIVGGDLDSNEPYFVVRGTDGVASLE